MTPPHRIATPDPELQQDEEMTTMIASHTEHRSCRHTPPCPDVEASDRDAAHVVAAHPEQGWSLLCNGIVLFEDFGELLPSGESCASRRADLLTCSPHRRAS